MHAHDMHVCTHTGTGTGTDTSIFFLACISLEQIHALLYIHNSLRYHIADSFSFEMPSTLQYNGFHM